MMSLPAAGVIIIACFICLVSAWITFGIMLLHRPEEHVFMFGEPLSNIILILVIALLFISGLGCLLALDILPIVQGGVP
jgi:hypothetical protein